MSIHYPSPIAGLCDLPLTTKAVSGSVRWALIFWLTSILTLKNFNRSHHPTDVQELWVVVVAADDTIWFAEQYANYIGHYFPATGQFQTFPLPILTVPDPGLAGKTLTLPSAPNDLVLDKQGNIWFTELNANALGRLNIQKWADSTICAYNNKDDSIAQSIRDNYRSTGQYLVHGGKYESNWSSGSKNRPDQLFFHARVIDTAYGDCSRCSWHDLGYFVFIWSST